MVLSQLAVIGRQILKPLQGTRPKSKVLAPEVPKRELVRPCRSSLALLSLRLTEKRLENAAAMRSFAP